MKKITVTTALALALTSGFAQYKLEVIPPPATGNTTTPAATTPNTNGSNTSSVINTINSMITGGGDKSLGNGLGNDKIVDGLKEALTIASNTAGGEGAKKDGFFKNPLIKIPFPKEIQEVEKTVRSLGMGKEADKFVESLNRAAEDASKKAAPIFVNAVTGLSISDGLNILQGGDMAATNFLKNGTQSQLNAAFSPIVKQSLSKVNATKYWNSVAKTYNKVPFVKKMNPNLEQYVTEKAIDGLFTLVGEQEAKIRKDPAAQVTNLLQQVFGGKK